MELSRIVSSAGGITKSLFAETTYSASHNTTGGSSLNLLLDNPSDSGVDVLLYFGRVQHESDATVTVWEEVSSVSGGVNVTVNNNYVESENSSDVMAMGDVTFTGESEQSQVAVAGAGDTNLFIHDRLVIPSGSRVVIDVELGSTGNLAAKLAFAEVET